MALSALPKQQSLTSLYHFSHHLYYFSVLISINRSLSFRSENTSWNEYFFEKHWEFSSLSVTFSVEQTCFLKMLSSGVLVGRLGNRCASAPPTCPSQWSAALFSLNPVLWPCADAHTLFLSCPRKGFRLHAHGAGL